MDIKYIFGNPSLEIKKLFSWKSYARKWFYSLVLHILRIVGNQSYIVLY